MSETTHEDDACPPPVPAPAEADSSAPPTVAAWETLLAAHQNWLASSGTSASGRLVLRDRCLAGALLENKDLRGADLSGSDLTNADLRNAQLGRALFARPVSGTPAARIVAADLSGCDLSGARWDGADVAGTRFRDAILRGCDLSHVRSLLDEQLGGTDLCGAILRADMAGFEGLRNVEELSKNAGKLFVSSLLACGFAFLTVIRTRDIEILTDTGTADLPIIQAAIPITIFFTMAPLVLVGVYGYFHLYLQRLWEAFAVLPAVFPDGRTLDKKSYPWLISDFIRVYFPRLRGQQKPLGALEHALYVFLSWYLLPLALLPLWARYLVRHEPNVTVLHVVLIGVAVVIGLLSFRLAKATLRDAVEQETLLQPLTGGNSLRAAAPLLATPFASAAALLGLSSVLFWGVPDHQPDAANNALFALRRFVPRVFDRFGCCPFADLREAKAPSARLANRDLSGARAAQADLTNADLRGANLRGADLKTALLAGADLEGAHLEGAQINPRLLKQCRNWLLATYDDKQRKALLAQMPRDHNQRVETKNLARYELGGLSLARASLAEAKLAHAALWQCDLKGAELQKAELTGANLQDAHLEGANLDGTQLDDANFAGAHLEGAWVDVSPLMNRARCALLAHLDAEQLSRLGFPRDHDEQVKRKDLRERNLSGLNLSGGDFGGFDLSSADLSNARLNGANLHAARLTDVLWNNTRYDDKTVWPPDFRAADHPGLIRDASPATAEPNRPEPAVSRK